MSEIVASSQTPLSDNLDDICNASTPDSIIASGQPSDRSDVNCNEISTTDVVVDASNSNTTIIAAGDDDKGGGEEAINLDTEKVANEVEEEEEEAGPEGPANIEADIIKAEVGDANELDSQLGTEKVFDTSLASPATISSTSNTSISSISASTASEISISPSLAEVPNDTSAAANIYDTYYMIFRCNGTTVTNFNFKGLGISGMFSFGSPKNEIRKLIVSKSNSFPKSASRSVVTGYEVIYESDAFDDGNPNFFPSLVANLTIEKVMDCKLRFEVHYSSSKTGNTWVFLSGNTVTLRESIKSIRSADPFLILPMVSEYSIGGALQVEFIARFPRLLSVNSLSINSPTGYMNPLVQRYVFYNDANKQSPIVDFEEILVEPRLTLRSSSMVIQATMVTIEKSMDAWKKRFHIERMRQGFFKDYDEVFNHGWHHVQVSISASRLKLKKDKIPKFEKLPENHARRTTTYVTMVPLIDEQFTSAIEKAKNSLDISRDHTTPSESPDRPQSMGMGMSSVSGLSNLSGAEVVMLEKAGTDRKKQPFDEMYPSTYVSCSINDRAMGHQFPIGRTNTEYYCTEAFYGSNVNASHKSKPIKNASCAPNVYHGSSPKSFMYGQVVSTMYADTSATSSPSQRPDRHGSIQVFDTTSSKGEEHVFNIFVPSLEGSIDFELHLEEYLGKLYGPEFVGGTVSLNLKDCLNGTVYDWMKVNFTSPEIAGLFESADVLIKLNVVSSIDDYRGKMFKAVDFCAPDFKIDGLQAKNMYTFYNDAVPSSTFYVPYRNEKVYAYDRSNKTIQYGRIPFIRPDDSPSAHANPSSTSGDNNNDICSSSSGGGGGKSEPSTDRGPFQLQLDEKCLIADCYEWLYSIGYSGFDPLMILSRPRKLAHPSFVSYCSDESSLSESERSASQESGLFIFNRVDGHYSLTKIMQNVNSLQEIIDELVELQIEVSDMMQKGLAFRPSGMKKNQNVQSLPVNLHYQFSMIRGHTMQLPSKLKSNPVVVNSNVTCGCFTSHKLGYKNGGILNQESKLLILRKEIDDAKNIYLNSLQKRESLKLSSPVTEATASTGSGTGRDSFAAAPLSTSIGEIMEKIGSFDEMCISIGLRRVYVMSQALCVLINSLHMKLCMVIEGHIRHEAALKWLDCGFLLMFQGLLSVSGAEKTMLEDTISAIESLNLFQVRLQVLEGSGSNEKESCASPQVTCHPDDPKYDVLDVKSNDNYVSIQSSKKVHEASHGKKSEGFDFSAMGRGNFANQEKGKTQVFINGREVVMYIAHDAVELLPERYRIGMKAKGGLVMNIKAILFSQGIDIQQSIASTFSADIYFLQSDINMNNFHKLNEYVKTYFYRSEDNLAGEVHRLCSYIRDLLDKTSTSTKNVLLLNELERLVVILNGCLATFCKSGKDRTGMVVSYREARNVCESFGCGTPNSLEASAIKISNVFREYGCRLRICEKNTGKRVFSFNKLQCQFLPTIYRPPDNVTEDLIKSGDNT